MYNRVITQQNTRSLRILVTYTSFIETTVFMLSAMFGMVMLLRGIHNIVLFFVLNDIFSHPDEGNKKEFLDAFKNRTFIEKLTLVFGILMIIFGFVSMLNPELTAPILVFILATWLIFDGITGLIESRSCESGFAKLLKIVLNALVIIGAFLIVFNAIYGFIVMTIIVGVSIITSGVALIVNAFQTKKKTSDDYK